MSQAVGTGREDALTEEQMRELEARYDPEVRFRQLPPFLGRVAAVLLFILSCYHFYTAGYGIPQATTHRGLHLAFTLALVFLSFVAFGAPRATPRSKSRHLLAPLGLPILDWIFAIAGAVSALYVPWIFNDLAFRVGDPLPI
ncbi:MAG TPA: TRAP transporter permease, partial [Paracoccaceae bacterium]|nr:TRAP transporter permease [Paracoccaceae bacterium]